ncbi:MAG: gamma-glutamylcyclotransferase [Gammaproteobacteria bacterium]|nr:MAG: gamma-glutamylcyclotransferase [Gammaproteobacteria bacterium]
MKAGSLYFAYGSNLNPADWQRFCRKHGEDPGVLRPVGPGWLPDYRPVYHYRSASRGGGALDVTPERSHATPGLLFEIRPEGWRVLDHKEGAPNFYARQGVAVLLGAGEIVSAITYCVTPGRREAAFIPPSADYSALVAAGLLQWGLPTAAHAAAAAGHAPQPLIHHLFVYGLLQSAWGATRTIPGVSSCGRATAPGQLFDLGAYPGWQPSVNANADVVGELLEMENPDEALAQTDRIEGCHGYQDTSRFRRVLLRATAADGTVALAWCYRYMGAVSGGPIRGGAWPPVPVAADVGVALSGVSV